MTLPVNQSVCKIFNSSQFPFDCRRVQTCWVPGEVSPSIPDVERKCSRKCKKRGKQKIQRVPPLRISNNGETYAVHKNMEIQESTETEMDITRMSDDTNANNNEMTQQDGNWKVVTPSKRRKITTNANTRRAAETESKQWLQEIPLQNPFSILPQEKEPETTEKPKHNAKPPPIYIDAQVIDPLVELLNNTAGKENYSIKQLKLDQVKVLINAPETYRKVVKVLKEKNAGYHTYQLKTDKSYKAVIRGLHPKTNTSNICDELAKIGHQIRIINNITRFNTKQPLLLFLIELEPKNNNKEIFEIKQILNTNPQQDRAEAETPIKVQHVMNNNHNNTNTTGSRSYAQATKEVTPVANQNHNNNTNDATEIKELLKQSIKSTDMLTRTISELNEAFIQQSLQITAMIQLITTMLSKK
ncbi:uncharacterized protein LOC132908682 [Bombus pascuorum]|uniref:uncharacterized protein LOC132908682 n=1 Tax=Bombus pascuorum TaxID=65598 RepID=UPI00298E9080|nr:uncharacterized protein LOC132908682 [Bombus pascuorum]